MSAAAMSAAALAERIGVPQDDVADVAREAQYLGLKGKLKQL